MKFKFNGNGVYFFVVQIGFGILDFISFGLVLPIHIYWNIVYFIENTSIADKV